jgi:hypothetical protein
VKDVCEALVLVLKNEVITCPVDSDTWQEIAIAIESLQRVVPCTTITKASIPLF